MKKERHKDAREVVCVRHCVSIRVAWVVDGPGCEKRRGNTSRDVSRRVLKKSISLFAVCPFSFLVKVGGNEDFVQHHCIVVRREARKQRVENAEEYVRRDVRHGGSVSRQKEPKRRRAGDENMIKRRFSFSVCPCSPVLDTVLGWVGAVQQRKSAAFNVLCWLLPGCFHLVRTVDFKVDHRKQQM